MSWQKWTQSDIDYVKYCYTHFIDLKTCAEKLNRSVNAVYTKAFHLGYTKIFTKPPCEKANKKISDEEELQICLSCTKPDCNNCLENGG